MKHSGVGPHVSIARESAFAIAFAAVIHVCSFLLGSPELGSTPVAITGPIAFTALLIRGRRAIPAVVAGFLLGDLFRTPAIYLLLTAITYTTVYLIGSAVLRRISASEDPLDWVVGERSTAAFIGL